MKTKQVSYNMVIYAILILILFINIIPVYQILCNTFKSIDEYNGAQKFAKYGTNELWPPKELTLSSLKELLQVSILPRSFLNNIIVSVAVVIILEVVGAAVSLILAQYSINISNSILNFIIGARAIPPALTMIMIFMISRNLKLLDTYQGVIIALVACTLPLTIFLFYNYYIDLPRELIESAEIDGATFWQTFSRVILPMSGPILGTVGILNFINIWATFLIGLTLLRREEMHLLSQVVQNLEQWFDYSQSVYYAAFFVICLPMVMMLHWAQRYIVAGMTEGAVKQ